MAVGLINVSPNDITGNSTGKPPASIDSAFYRFGQFPEMCIAGREFTPGITNADNRLVIEFVVWYALVLHPGTINKSIFA